uniref:YTH domain-containing protein n=2 Tax=Caenorhabditis tropicalis TaxID=1561998 RepID=A0A1I7V4Y4_9PELO
MCQRELNIWEFDQTQIDRMRQQRMAEELSTKVLSNEQKSRKGKHHRGVFPKKNHPQTSSNCKLGLTETSEMEKKSPILVWTSHVIVEIPDEFFDGRHVYTWNRKEYLKVHGTPTVPIRIQNGKLDFNTVMIPTQNIQLIMLIFYGYDTKLCSMESMRHIVSNFCDSKGPCIVRKRNNNDVSVKKSIYFPNWKVKNFPANRIAQHIVASANLHSLFVCGGFGDLAVPDAVPSATGDPKKISHLQHYALLSFRNSPNENSTRNLLENP